MLFSGRDGVYYGSAVDRSGVVGKFRGEPRGVRVGGGGAFPSKRVGVSSGAADGVGRMLPTFDIITTDSAREPRDYKDNITTTARDLLAINFTYIHRGEKMCACVGVQFLPHRVGLCARARVCVARERERKRDHIVFFIVKAFARAPKWD